MLSRTAEYALLATVCLGHRPEVTRTSEELARVTRTPGPYLANVLKSLVRSDLLASRPGRLGGYVLVGKVHELTLLDIVNAVDPVKVETNCQAVQSGNGGVLCPIHDTIHQAQMCVARTLEDRTVADVLDGSCMVPDLGPDAGGSETDTHAGAA